MPASTWPTGLPGIWPTLLISAITRSAVALEIGRRGTGRRTGGDHLATGRRYLDGLLRHPHARHWRPDRAYSGLRSLSVGNLRRGIRSDWPLVAISRNRLPSHAG